MNEKNKPFKKTGIVFLAAGLVDLALLLFCLYKAVYYSSNLSIFGIIFGIVLIIGNVKAARVIRWMCIFIAEVALGIALIKLFSKPADLLVTQIKLNPVITATDIVAGLIFLGVFLWAYIQLSKREAIAAFAQAGYKTGKPVSAIIAGIVILLLIAVLSYVVLTGESAAKAKALAEARVGSGVYKFAIDTISIEGEHGSAVVLVYDSNRIGSVDVKW